MGEAQNQSFQLSLNASLKIDFQGSRVTSDGSLILVRELNERLGFGELIEQHLTDLRRGKNTQFPFTDLLQQSVYSRLAGYEEMNDAERLSQGPKYAIRIPANDILARGVEELLKRPVGSPGDDFSGLTGGCGNGCDRREKKTCSPAPEWMYIFNCRKAKTLIPVKNSSKS